VTSRARIHFASPGPLDQPTGGYRYDKRILDRLERKHVDCVRHELPGQFPEPDAAALDAAGRLWDGLGPSDLLVVDGLALPAFENAVLHAGSGPRLVVLVHHPVCLETGLSPEAAAQWRRREAALLQAADRVLVTSRSTATEIAAMGVDAAAVHVVIPGTEKVRMARGSDGGDLVLLCVASLIPRKGHLLLVSALSALRHLRWRLDCVGPADRHPETLRDVQDAIRVAGLGDRVRLCGALSDAELATHYDRSDLFVLASRYEGYGMAFAEALAHGLPVIASGGGAVRDTVPPSAGMLVPPGDMATLTAALAAVMSDRRLRGRLRDGARAAGATLPDWEQQADRFLAAVSA